jgi:hypothetical protein
VAKQLRLPWSIGMDGHSRPDTRDWGSPDNGSITIVAVMADGRVSDPASVSLGDVQVPLHLRLAVRAAVYVAVQVRDKGGVAVPGAGVRAFPGFVARSSGETDADGRCALQVPSGQFGILATTGDGRVGRSVMLVGLPGGKVGVEIRLDGRGVPLRLSLSHAVLQDSPATSVLSAWPRVARWSGSSYRHCRANWRCLGPGVP